MIDASGHPDLRRRTPDLIDLRRYAYETCFFWQQATFFRRRAFLQTNGFNLSSQTAWDGELVVGCANSRGDRRHRASKVHMVSADSAAKPAQARRLTGR